MNYTQNDKINQIKDIILVVEIDIAKCTDNCGRDLDKYIEFQNSVEGFDKLMIWI